MQPDPAKYTVHFAGEITIRYESVAIHTTVWGGGAAQTTLRGITDEAVLTQALYNACRDAVKRARVDLARISVEEAK